MLAGDLLRAQVFFDRQRKVGATFHGGVVGHDDAFDPRDAANAGHHASGRHIVVVNVVGGQRRKFQKRRAFVNQVVDAITYEQLATALMAGTRLLTAALRNGGGEIAQLVDFAAHGGVVGLKRIAARVDLCRECAHSPAPVIIVKDFR